MATGDLWYNKLNFSTNNRAWSVGLWMEETTPLGVDDDGGIPARALNAHLQTQLLDVINVDTLYESCESYRRFPGESLPGFVRIVGGTGTRTGDAMPNDNALYINLRQEAQDAKHNGGIYIAGQSDSDHANSEWTSGYLSTQVTAFTDRLPLQVNAASGDVGTFRIVVLSKTFTPPSTTIGTPFDVTSAVATNRVLTQRRRAQKTRGFALTTT